MAKVTAPLLSFSARGQIAKAIVFSVWKGINVARQYVVPANPQSPAQIVQRGYFEDAVAEWHLPKYLAADITAWNLYARYSGKIMSGFNAFVKSWLDIARLALTSSNPPFYAGILPDGAGQFQAYLREDGEATSARVHWGYSPTAMHTMDNLAEAPAETWTLAGIAATTGATVYARLRTQDGADTQGWSGIYTVLIT